MVEISFCPQCGAQQHKLLNYKDTSFFCRDCNHFFSVSFHELTCPKCEHTKIEDSDFPGAHGEIILQCKKCKKMFSAKELLEHNGM